MATSRQRIRRVSAGRDPRRPIIPTPQRLRASPSFTGRGVTIAFLDSGFYPHPDLTIPRVRVLGYHNVLCPGATPAERLAELCDTSVDSWHGMMTSVVAAGNGTLSRGLYRGIASESEVVLVKVGSLTRIEHDHIRQGVEWVRENRERFGIRVLNISCGGDYNRSYLVDPLCASVENAVREGIVVVAAAGNRGGEEDHAVIPPANSPAAITVGGIDDKNRLDWRGLELYRSSYGPTADGLLKPEVVSPAIWLAAPILPATPVAAQARALLELRDAGDDTFRHVLACRSGADEEIDRRQGNSLHELREAVRERIEQNNVITPYYKHVDGTSFAAPVVSSIAAQMLEANPCLSPWDVKCGLIATARRLRRTEVDRQGWGIVRAGAAVEWALARR
jgi:serine protease AprX